jgi:hypothetical protein
MRSTLLLLLNQSGWARFTSTEVQILVCWLKKVGISSEKFRRTGAAIAAPAAAVHSRAAQQLLLQQPGVPASRPCLRGVCC